LVYVDIYPQISNNDWIVFRGDNAAGQKLFKAKPSVIWFNEIQKIFTNNIENTPSIYGQIEEYVNAALPPIDSLKNLNEISGSFAKELKKAWLVMMYSMITMNYDYDVISHFKEDGKLTPVDSIVIQDSRVKIYNIFPPLDTNILAYNIYGNTYLISYLNMVYKNVDPSNKRYLTVFNKRGNYGFLPDNLQKPMLGNAILYEYRNDTGDLDIDKATDFFRKKYPDSEYLPIIDKIAATKKQQQAEQTKIASHSEKLASSKTIINPTQFDGEILIDTSAVATNIKTLRDLHATYFKGKKIFIDLWATWCLPCRQEFAYKEQLDSLLKIHNIIPVLLSVDQSNLKNYWVRFVNKNKLKGYNFLISETLQKDICNITGNAISSGMPIPHYIYMNEQGEIIEKNAPHPSEIEKLADLFARK